MESEFEWDMTLYGQTAITANNQMTVLDSACPDEWTVISLVKNADIIEVFKHCDLATRCKIRRVSRDWKRLVSLPDVNRVALIDWYCLLVSCPGIATDRPSQLRFAVWDYAKDVEVPCKKPGHAAGWCDVKEPYAGFVHLRDHERNGLLGPHVQSLIYNGFVSGHPNHSDHLDTVRAIQSIAMYCSQVQDIVLWRLGPQAVRFRRADLQANPNSLLPKPRSLRIVASRPVLAYVRLPDGVDECHLYSILGTMDVWRDVDQSDDQLMKECVVCTDAQREWIAKYAPRLPSLYHDWAQCDAEVIRAGCHVLSVEPVRMNLRESDYTRRLDWPTTCFLLALAHCILRENTPNTVLGLCLFRNLKSSGSRRHSFRKRLVPNITD